LNTYRRNEGEQHTESHESLLVARTQLLEGEGFIGLADRTFDFSP
jgi:hypothetical protein